MVNPWQRDAPSLIAVLRGGRIESRHRVVWAVADARGRMRARAGDAGQPVFPRSAVKPLQALALVESGAVERFGLGARELALACASHSGEVFHVETVAAWLERLGLEPEALACGTHLPLHEGSAQAVLRSGRTPTPLHNNCSGKHAGMLTLARHLGVPITGYLDPTHPVQQRIAAAIAAMAGLEALPEPAVDGCGVPTWPLPLAALATAMARLADPSGLAPERAAACRRIVAAMRAHPELVAGSDRACTRIMRAAPGVVVKAGAEGVHTAAWPEGRLGIALKVEDGSARAAPVALLALLEAAGALTPEARAALGPLVRPVVRNHAGRRVGEIRPDEGWPGTLPPAG